jgi:hypothetical protein
MDLREIENDIQQLGVKDRAAPFHPSSPCLNKDIQDETDAQDKGFLIPVIL